MRSLHLLGRFREGGGSIKLFEHGQAACDALQEQLAITGKAAAIHPSGTGESFIVFKLAKERPEALFAWISPSDLLEPEICRTSTDAAPTTGGFSVSPGSGFGTYGWKPEISRTRMCLACLWKGRIGEVK